MGDESRSSRRCCLAWISTPSRHTCVSHGRPGWTLFRVGALVFAQGRGAAEGPVRNGQEAGGWTRAFLEVTLEMGSSSATTDGRVRALVRWWEGCGAVEGIRIAVVNGNCCATITDTYCRWSIIPGVLVVYFYLPRRLQWHAAAQPRQWLFRSSFLTHSLSHPQVAHRTMTPPTALPHPHTFPSPCSHRRHQSARSRRVSIPFAERRARERNLTEPANAGSAEAFSPPCRIGSWRPSSWSPG